MEPEMIEIEETDWWTMPDFIPCCDDQDCPECDGENLKANPDHPNNWEPDDPRHQL